MCMMIGGAADRVWLMKIWCVQWEEKILHEIVCGKLCFRKLCLCWLLKMLTDEHKMKQAT
jgi:hypothetical protein